MEPILEFNAIFDDEEYIINIQTKSDLLNITIELEAKNLYWSKTLDSKTLSEITSQMGSYKSLKVFSDMLIQALSKKNDSLSLNFCSLNEIQQLSGSNDLQMNNEENNIKKYLMMIYTSFEKVVYPIQMEFLGNNPNKELLQRTIRRLKNKISKLQNENKSILNNSISLSKSSYNENIPINYNEFEKLKKENENLLNKIKILQTKTVNDDIFKKYNELSEKYDTYKKMKKNKMKLLVTSLEELKQKESEAYLQEKEKEKNRLNSKNNNKNISKIAELEKKLEISSEQLLNERKQNLRVIEEKNYEIDSLKKEIKTYKEQEKTYKVKISNLEKDLEREKKGSAYYKNKTGTRTPSRKAKSFYSEGSVSCNESYISSYSKKTTTSYLKKNLIPKNSYQRAKNYLPYNSKKKEVNRKNSKSKNRSRSGSKKSSGSNSIVSKSIKGPSTLYQRTYKSPYRYEPNNNRNSSKKNSKNKNRMSPSKNLLKKNNDSFLKKENNKKFEIKNKIESNYENDYNKDNSININLNNDNSINNIDLEKKDNLNEDSNNIADRLSRLQALISQVSGK